jgi:hypothetical protein
MSRYYDSRRRSILDGKYLGISSPERCQLQETGLTEPSDFENLDSTLRTANCRSSTRDTVARNFESIFGRKGRGIWNRQHWNSMPCVEQFPLYNREKSTRNTFPFKLLNAHFTKVRFSMPFPQARWEPTPSGCENMIPDRLDQDLCSLLDDPRINLLAILFSRFEHTAHLPPSNIESNFTKVRFSMPFPQIRWEPTPSGCENMIPDRLDQEPCSLLDDPRINLLAILFSRFERTAHVPHSNIESNFTKVPFSLPFP